MKTMTIEQYKKYQDEIDNGYINIHYHPEDRNIVILNYTEQTTFEKHWNNETMSARGLILDLTDAKDNGIINILATPFKKFPNYGSNEIVGYEDDIDQNHIESITEKMDGSLGISYIFKGELRFATKGSFVSDQALRATEMWHTKYREANEKYKELCMKSQPTILVEIIYPENRVVVDYKGEEKLVLLGVTNGDVDVKYSIVKGLGDYFRLPVTPTYQYSINQLLSMKKTISANEEGWIVRFSNGKRLKIKGDEYLQVHRIKHGMSEKAKFKAWADGSLLEYIMMLPEEFRPELEDFGDKLDKLKDAQYTLFQAFFEMIQEQSTDKKSFALLTNQLVSQEYRKFMFDAYKNGSISVQMIRDEIYKNYSEYIEVIKTWNSDL